MINSKFWPLANYFTSINQQQVVLTFSQIESILGVPLCMSARKHNAYWHPPATHMLPNVCLEAGYKITDIDLKNEKIRFEKL